MTAYDSVPTRAYAPLNGIASDRDDGGHGVYGAVGRLPQDYGPIGVALKPTDTLAQRTQQLCERPAWPAVPAAYQRRAYAPDQLDDLVLRVIETYRMLDALFGRHAGDYAPPTPPESGTAAPRQ